MNSFLNYFKNSNFLSFFLSFLNYFDCFRTSVYGEQSIEVAPIWYEYGRALLMKEQENPSDDLLGAVAAEAKKQAKVISEELNVLTTIILLITRVN